HTYCACVKHLLVEKQRVCTGLAGTACQTTDFHRIGKSKIESGYKRVHLQAEWIRQQYESRLLGAFIADQLFPECGRVIEIRALLIVDVEGSDLDIREHGSRKGDSRFTLHLLPTANQSPSRATDEGLGSELRGNRSGNLAEFSHKMGRHK